MRKGLLCITLISCLLISTACQGINTKTSTGDNLVKPEESGVPEITILVTPNTKSWMQNNIFVSYKSEFEKKYGVKVNYEVYGSLMGNDANREELMMKLLRKDGPELILDDTWSSMPLIKQGAVVEVSGKISNVSKIYDSLVGSQVYYIPLGIYYEAIMLKSDTLEQLQLPEPNVNWIAEEYYNLYDKWLNHSNRLFTRFEFNEITYKYLGRLKTFDYVSKKANINTQEVKMAINKIREIIFSGEYILNKNYNYENFYNMLYESSSEELKANKELLNSKEYEEQSLRSRSKESITNALIMESVELRRTSKLVVLPNCLTEKAFLWSLGFLVNKNGANLELAYEYVNGLLSDEIQLKIYEDEELEIYPANKEVEDKITEIEKNKGYSNEAMKLKQFILGKIHKGECWLSELEQIKERENYWMLVEDLAKFILADKAYTDTELSAELQKLEDKYNIYLSE